MSLGINKAQIIQLLTFLDSGGNLSFIEINNYISLPMKWIHRGEVFLPEVESPPGEEEARRKTVGF